MTQLKLARREVVSRLQDGLRSEPIAGQSFAEHINGVLDAAATELRPEENADHRKIFDSFVDDLRPTTDASSAAYKRNLATIILQSYGQDVSRAVASSMNSLALTMASPHAFPPQPHLVNDPPKRVDQPGDYNDLIGLQPKAKDLLNRIFGNTFSIPS